MVSAFEGNKAETKAMLPVIESFMAAHDLPRPGHRGRADLHPALASHQGRRDKVIFYQYRHDRARRTLRGIDEQVKKVGAGQAPVKRR